jgi:phosphohistidine phosphatase
VNAGSRPVQIFLVRHAIAAERGPEWSDDSKRPLTHKGVARMRQVVGGLRALGVRLDLIGTSPLVRARQTADVLVAGLKPTPELSLVSAMAPGHPPAELAAALKTMTVAHGLALVGHEPGLGELAAWMVGARTALPFKKGGVCLVELPSLARPRDGTLIWMATPRMLRSLAE